MDLLELLKISFTSLKTNKLRSILTMLGVIIGVFSVVTLLAIGSGLKNYISQQFEALGSNLIFVFPGEFVSEGASYSFTQEAAFFDFKFNKEDVVKIKREVENQNGVVPLIRKTEKIRYKGEEKTVLVVGTTKEYSRIRNTKAEKGRFFNQSEAHAAKRVIVLGAKTASDLFGQADPLGKRVSLGAYKFKVVGVAEKKGQGTGFGFNIDEFVYIPLQTAEKIFNLSKYNAIMVQTVSQKAIRQVKAKVKKTLLSRLDEDEFTVMDQEELLSVIKNILGVFSAALGGIAAISLIVGGIGIMNIMFVSVTERTREIGLRKAVGATPYLILKQFLTEAIILSLSGGTIGLFLGVWGSFLLRSFFPTTVTLWSALIAFGVSTLVGVVFGVAPALKASKLNPIDALRYE